ncbi:DNA helicase [Corynebacterium sp. TAE3-ERU30]|nr:MULTISPECIES: cory-CC-star protein [Corynebacterium]MBV7282287.1 DNA helicase [Corynebacterium sp. TAE3-ERU30]MBV7302366.1 DNA helicase [Corynebacterium sp. TAE3-ERU2]
MTAWPAQLLDAFKKVSRGMEEFYVSPYRATFAQAQREEDDLFMMLVLSEALGIDNPASFYTIELLPIIYEDFHAWHTRMGLEHSPVEHIQCC